MEGDVDARLGVFRAIVHAATLIHFLPTALHFDENYGERAFRSNDWHPSVARLDGHVGSVVCTLLLPLAGSASLTGLVGVQPRLSAGLAGVCWWLVASVNSIHTQTLALGTLWAILSIWCIVGEGGAPITVWPGRRPESRSTALVRLIVFYLLGTLFFSGITKIASNWPFSGSWYRLARYPSGGVVRDWFLGLDLTPNIATALEVCTVAAEIALPALVLIPRLRLAATWCYVALFVSMFAVFELPPLFGALYIGGAVPFGSFPKEQV